MWLPMWVFDGNGFTMECLAVWIRNLALPWGVCMGGQLGAVNATALKGSSQLCRDQGSNPRLISPCRSWISLRSPRLVLPISRGGAKGILFQLAQRQNVANR